MRRFLEVAMGAGAQSSVPIMPVYRGGGTLNSSTTTATPGAPTGLSTGDLEILVGGTEFGQTLSVTSDGGSAWTALTGSPANVANSTPAEVLYVWWRVRAGGDSDPTITCSANHAVAFRLAVQTGTFNAASPLEIEHVSGSIANSTSYSYAPGTSTTGANRMVFAIASSGLDSNVLEVTAAANASLANVNNTSYNNTLSGNGGGMNACYGELAVAGSVGTFAATWTTTTKKNYCSFAVKPG